VRPLLLLLTLLIPAVRAQGDAPVLHVGGGLVPGVGAYASFARPTLSLFTQEGALYADYTPTGERRLLVAVGVGGGVRVFRVADLLGQPTPPGLDLDAGVRLGPAFYFSLFEETAAGRARSFRVMFDPFARASLDLAGRRVFGEVGAQAPTFRGGLALSF